MSEEHGPSRQTGVDGMHVLVSTIPSLSHFRRMVPVMTGLAAVGFEVAFAGSAARAGDLSRLGVRHYAAGLNHFPSFRGSPSIAQWRQYLQEKALPVMTEAMFHDMYHVIGDFRPDLVIRDFSDRGAYLAAEQAGIPNISVATGGAAAVVDPSVPTTWLEQVRMRLDLPPLRSAIALSDLMHICFHPARFHGAHARFPEVARFVRHENALDDNHEGLRELLRLRDAALPTVIVATGTIVPHLYRDTIKPMREYLSGENFNLVALIGSAKQTGLEQLGEREFVFHNAPQQALLRYADVVVTHGGFNTVVEALASGVPVVTVPMEGGQGYTADRIDELGAGKQCPLEEAGQGCLRDAVWTVLGDPAYREAARSFQVDNDNLPTVAQLAREELAPLVTGTV